MCIICPKMLCAITTRWPISRKDIQAQHNITKNNDYVFLSKEVVGGGLNVYMDHYRWTMLNVQEPWIFSPFQGEPRICFPHLGPSLTGSNTLVLQSCFTNPSYVHKWTLHLQSRVKCPSFTPTQALQAYESTTSIWVVMRNDMCH